MCESSWIRKAAGRRDIWSTCKSTLRSQSANRDGPWPGESGPRPVASNRVPSGVGCQMTAHRRPLSRLRLAVVPLVSCAATNLRAKIGQGRHGMGTIEEGEKSGRRKSLI